jgi:N-acetylneuraminic acid mutarotase
MHHLLFRPGVAVSLIGLILLLTQSGCKKEEPFDHPVVFTGDIMNVTTTGALFFGKITDQGNGIIDHGFVWDYHEDPVIGKAYQVSLGPLESEVFSKDAKAAFIKNRTYYVRAYASDSRYTVYGRTAKFISLGGLAPKITEFHPKEGTWNDTLIIRGNNFSRMLDENLVKLGSITLNCIYASDTLLKAVVPTTIHAISSSLTLTVYGNTSSVGQPFVLLPPQILEITPDEGTIAQIVTLKGKNFHPQTTVFFDNRQVEIVKASWNEITFKIPYLLGEKDVKIRVNVMNQNSSDNFVFRFRGPVITGLSSTTGKWEDWIVIYGRNLPHQNIEVYFNEYTLAWGVSHKSKDSIRVMVPRHLTNYSNHIFIHDKTHWSHHPPVKSEMTFELIKPVITRIEPDRGTFNDEIVIYGSHFHPSTDFNQVMIGNAEARILMHTGNMMKIKVPVALEELNAKVSVLIHDYTATSSGLFYLDPPRIDKIEHLWFTRSHPIKIIGSGFNPDYFYNKVWVGNERLSVEVKNTGLLHVHQIYSNEPIETPQTLKVEIGGKTIQWPEQVRFYEPWIFQYYEYFMSSRDVGFSVGDRHFQSGHWYSYDFFEIVAGTGNRIKRAPLPVKNASYDYLRTSTFTTASKGYIFHPEGFFSYDPQSDKWTRLNDFPGSFTAESFAFNAGENGYIMTVSTTNPTRQVWRYNETGDSWSRVADFPAAGTLRGISFTMHGKGYLGLVLGANVNKLWEYDPVSNSWTEKVDLSGVMGYQLYVDRTVFVMDNFVYIAGGRKPDEFATTNNYYRYDPVSNVCTMLAGLPYDNYGSFGYSHLGKGYITGGEGRWHSPGIYIFDPLKLPPALMPNK